MMDHQQVSSGTPDLLDHREGWIDGEVHPPHQLCQITGHEPDLILVRDSLKRVKTIQHSQVRRLFIASIKVTRLLMNRRRQRTKQ